MHEGENNQDFLKWEGAAFLGHSLIIIKWTWGFFSKSLQFDPHTHPLQLGTKDSSKLHGFLIFGILKAHSQVWDNFWQLKTL